LPPAPSARGLPPWKTGKLKPDVINIKNMKPMRRSIGFRLLAVIAEKIKKKAVNTPFEGNIFIPTFIIITYRMYPCQ